MAEDTGDSSISMPAEKYVSGYGHFKERRQV